MVRAPLQSVVPDAPRAPLAPRWIGRNATKVADLTTALVHLSLRLKADQNASAGRGGAAPRSGSAVGARLLMLRDVWIEHPDDVALWPCSGQAGWVTVPHPFESLTGGSGDTPMERAVQPLFHVGFPCPLQSAHL